MLQDGQKNRKTKIALIGPYPPPYGGISVHIQRMATYLKAKNIEYVIYDTSGTIKKEENVICISNLKRWIVKYFLFAKEDIIHYHSPNWILRAVFGLMSFLGKKTIISIHGESLGDSLKSAGWLRKTIILFSLKHTSLIIADNKKIKKLVFSLGIPSTKIELIPAFIPPLVKEEDFETIPENVRDFIDAHNPVISANAYKIVFYEETDLYGIDMCVDLCAGLKKKYPNIGLVFCLPEIGDYEYFKKLQREVKRRKIEDNILFVTEPIVAYPIWMKSDVFIRPTCTDGDAISIREAIYFKVPVVTSDAVPRPSGVVLFENRNISDFVEKTKSVLDNHKEYKDRANGMDAGNSAQRILEVYNELSR